MRTEISDIIQSFFIRFSQEFRSRNLEAFEIIMALALKDSLKGTPSDKLRVQLAMPTAVIILSSGQIIWVFNLKKSMGKSQNGVYIDLKKFSSK